MSIKKIRWSRVYESSEEELIEFLRSRNIQATRFVAEAFSEQPQQSTDTKTTLWCAEGSLALRTGSTKTSLQPGDAVHLDAQTTYDLQAGISGYVCYISG